MKTIAEIQSVFPIKVEITQEIIDTAVVEDPRNCIGAKLLKQLFPDEDCYWMFYIGWFDLKEARIHITTEENVKMTTVIKPQFVTLILN